MSGRHDTAYNPFDIGQLRSPSSTLATLRTFDMLRWLESESCHLFRRVRRSPCSVPRRILI